MVLISWIYTTSKFCRRSQNAEHVTSRQVQEDLAQSRSEGARMNAEMKLEVAELRAEMKLQNETSAKMLEMMATLLAQHPKQRPASFPSKFHSIVGKAMVQSRAE